MHRKLLSLLPRKLCQISELHSSPSGDMLSVMTPKVSLSPRWDISYTSNIHPMRGVPKLHPMRKSDTILKRGKDAHSWLIPNIILTLLANLVAGNYWCVQHHLQTGVTLASSYLSIGKILLVGNWINEYKFYDCPEWVQITAIKTSTPSIPAWLFPIPTPTLF